MPLKDVLLPRFCCSSPLPSSNLCRASWAFVQPCSDLNWAADPNETIFFFLVELVLILTSLTNPVADAGSQTCVPAQRRSQRWDVRRYVGVAFLQWWGWLTLAWRAAEMCCCRSTRSSTSGWYKHKQVIIQVHHWTTGCNVTQLEGFYLKYSVSVAGIHCLLPE